MMTAANFTKLGAALADAFTVYVPDRRGAVAAAPTPTITGSVTRSPTSTR